MRVFVLGALFAAAVVAQTPPPVQIQLPNTLVGCLASCTSPTNTSCTEACLHVANIPISTPPTTQQQSIIATLTQCNSGCGQDSTCVTNCVQTAVNSIASNTNSGTNGTTPTGSTTTPGNNATTTTPSPSKENSTNHTNNTAGSTKAGFVVGAATVALATVFAW